MTHGIGAAVPRRAAGAAASERGAGAREQSVLTVVARVLELLAGPVVAVVVLALAAGRPSWCTGCGIGS